MAAALGNIEFAERLLGAGADINARSSLGYTPLHYAVANQNIAMAEFLLKKGANPDPVDNSNRSLYRLLNQPLQVGSPPPLFANLKFQDRSRLTQLIRQKKSVDEIITVKIYVTGMGAKEKVITLKPGQKLTILEALREAGANEFSNLRKVQLSRMNADTGEWEPRSIDVDAIRKSSDENLNIPLQDGDRISVPEKGTVF